MSLFPMMVHKHIGQLHCVTTQYNEVDYIHKYKIVQSQNWIHCRQVFVSHSRFQAIIEFDLLSVNWPENEYVLMVSRQ